MKRQIKNIIIPSYFENTEEELFEITSKYHNVGDLHKSNRNKDALYKHIIIDDKRLKGYIINYATGEKVRSKVVKFHYHKTNGYYVYPDYPYKEKELEEKLKRVEVILWKLFILMIWNLMY